MGVLEKCFNGFQHFFSIMFESISWNTIKLALFGEFYGGDKKIINDFSSIVTTTSDTLVV